MNILYTISIKSYVIAIRIAALFNFKAKLWVEGRKTIFQKLAEATKEDHDIVWFHCASLGEFEQGKPIIEGYKIKHPTHKILLTFFSPTGYEIRKNYDGVDWVFYLPADTKKNAKQFISIINPIKVFFIKYEFWFNYMAELNKNNIPFYSVSSIFREEQSFFQYDWFAKQLNNVNHFFVQDENSKELLKNIGFFNCTVAGDTRFDSVISNIQNKISIPLIEEFSENKTTIICGSTWPKDEALLAKYIKENPNYNYIIAPHEMQHISELKNQTNALLFSKANNINIRNNNVLIIDSIGILSNIYKYGNLAYIGGGFGSGIHNILEAVTFGLPVVFGPNYQKFKEANELIELEGAKSISNYSELKTTILAFNDFDSSIGKNYIKNNAGATEVIIDSL
ncbi:MAG: 3-deoxy-D-manno-octulosonic acid transferase [Flavobacteriales bacterium]|jgi:3-deoxy-D-manno-octulosonic-acid transferase|nr:3-deoxy-D-manno-octulosonic acid transferase [Flavobacteriales bacterium]MBT5090596.1 3-deoxy-D-manno-octulosonic acid transferase [Flavobacteriales bacterium]